MSTVSRQQHRLALFYCCYLEPLFLSHIFISVYPGHGAVCYRISSRLAAQSLLPQLHAWMVAFFCNLLGVWLASTTFESFRIYETFIYVVQAATCCHWKLS